MNVLRGLRRVRRFFQKEKLDREMAEELRFHLKQREAENLQGGMSPDQAHQAAQRKFGGLEQIKERCRDERTWIWFEQFGQDLRYAARSLRRNPGFATVVVLTLALGIGANAAIFSVVHAVLLRGLPYAESDRVMRLLSTTGANFRGSTTAPDFLEWRDAAQSFDGMAGLIFNSRNMVGGGEPQRVPGARVSANYFDVLGVSPVLGRGFTP
jgi:hypothetical protein